MITRSVPLVFSPVCAPGSVQTEAGNSNRLVMRPEQVRGWILQQNHLLPARNESPTERSREETLHSSDTS